MSDNSFREVHHVQRDRQVKTVSILHIDKGKPKQLENINQPVQMILYPEMILVFILLNSQLLI